MNKQIDKLIKYVIAAVICAFVFSGFRLPGALANIDTHANVLWVTIIPAILASLLFVWLVYRINKSN